MNKTASINWINKKQIDETCKPLANRGIGYFIMQLVFNDFSTFVLSNYDPIFKLNEDYNSIQKFMNCEVKESDEIELKNLIENRRIHPANNIVRKNSECTFLFSAFSENELADNAGIYKANIKEFEEFCIHFVDAFIDLIISSNPSYRFSFILTNKSLRDAVIRQEYEKDISLSTREQECLLLAAQGKKPKEIARELNISNHTVEQYLKRVRKILGCDTITQAIVECIHRGIIGRVSSVQNTYQLS